MINRRDFVVNVAVLLGGSVVAPAKLLAVQSGMAINGYDPVAYQ